MTDCHSYGFMVELYDSQADMIREYQLTAYDPVKGNLEVAMYDVRNKRQFLKRMEIPSLSLQDLHLGNTVTVYARHFKVTGYNDPRTKEAMECLHDCVSFVVSPSYIDKLGELLSLTEEVGLRLVQLRLVQDHGQAAVVQLAGLQAGSRWEEVAGRLPCDCVRMLSKEEAGTYLDRARFPTTATYKNCTLCLIRPHILKEGGYGAMLSAIQRAGLQISAAETVHLQRSEATELFDVYKGVLPYYLKLVDNMTSGSLLALELRHDGGAVLPFRELCGPHDTDIARHLRPDSLRAVFGKDSAQNGVHCTDLEEDGDLECQYIFQAVLNK